MAKKKKKKASPKTVHELRQERERKYYTEHMAPLKGGSILDVGAVPDDSGPRAAMYPTILVACTDGKRRLVHCMQDPEGNGPGHPDIVVLGEGE